MHGAAAAARRAHAGGVPSLQELSVGFLVANIDCVSSFGVLPPGADQLSSNPNPNLNPQP